MVLGNDMLISLLGFMGKTKSHKYKIKIPFPCSFTFSKFWKLSSCSWHKQQQKQQKEEQNTKAKKVKNCTYDHILHNMRTFSVKDCFSSINSSTPTYLSDILHLYSPA